MQRMRQMHVAAEYLDVDDYHLELVDEEDCVARSVYRDAILHEIVYRLQNAACPYRGGLELSSELVLCKTHVVHSI